jgi:RNA polymerase sigma-70 factor (ECF subfamily)
MLLAHEDTDDVLQNTFIKIWKGLPGFRETSGLFTWMYRIATNEAITFLKARQRERAMIADDPDNVIKDRLKSDPYFNGDELFQKLLIAIDHLPPKQKTVFQMKYFDEMTYEDMAGILGTSVGALKASYFHAVRKIQGAFEATD